MFSDDEDPYIGQDQAKMKPWYKGLFGGQPAQKPPPTIPGTLGNIYYFGKYLKQFNVMVTTKKSCSDTSNLNVKFALIQGGMVSLMAPLLTLSVSWTTLGTIL